MKFELGFGSGTQTLEVPDANVKAVLKPNQVEVPVKGVEVVAKALRNPIGTPELSKIVKPGQKIALITSDVTRPVPSYKILPLILDELFSAGVAADDITVVFALGNHRKQTIEEQKKLVGEEVFNKVKCIDSDPNDCVHMGTTAKLNTPVEIFTPVAQADIRIGVANIEYHYFAGYSGGEKPIMPGCSTRAAIQSNHSQMISPDAVVGKLEGNPVRIDMEQALEICPLHFIVNVVLDEKKEILYAVAGHHIKAHREGCKLLDGIYSIPIKERADIVVCSQGGAPKDLNLYQTQKALDNAKFAVKKGGVIVLVGSCKEGLGEDVFERWMLEADSPKALIERVKTNFELGGHKAAAIALVLENSDIYLASEMDSKFVESIFLKPFETTQAAFNAAFDKFGPDASVIVMPYGGSTVPVLKG